MNQLEQLDELVNNADSELESINDLNDLQQKKAN